MGDVASVWAWLCSRCALIAFRAEWAQHDTMPPPPGPIDLHEQTRELILRCKESVDVWLSKVAEMRNAASEAREGLARSQAEAWATGDRLTKRSRVD